MSDNKFNQEHFSETGTELDNNQDGSEGYTFIQETIRPRKKARWKKLAFTVALGITFGGVACFTFCAFYPVFSNFFNVKEGLLSQATSNPSPSSTLKPVQTHNPTTAQPVTTISPKPSVAPTKDPDNGPSGDTNFDDFPSQIQNVKTKVGNALVTVNGVKTGVDILDNPNEVDNYTSGIIVHMDATKILIMTNSDIIAGANYITVRLSDNTTYKGELYGVHRQLGIALVKLDPSWIESRILDTLVVAEMGDSTVVQVGDPVIALGNPNGYMSSVDYGVISNEQQDAYITDGKLQLINTTIPHNANGNGFLMDRKGRIVGVITHKESFESDFNANLNTCLSMSSIRPYLQRIIDGQENVYLGIVGCDITGSIATELGVNQGIYITKVEENSPAFLAGIKKGDVLLEMHNVQMVSMTQYYNKLNNYRNGTRLSLKIMRKEEGNWATHNLEALVTKMK